MSCPFAHHVRQIRLLFGLEDIFEITFASGQTAEDGFIFASPEPEFGSSSLKQIYKKTLPDYEGEATVPAIVDRTDGSMVSHESLEAAIALARQCKTDDLDLLPPGTIELATDISDKVTIALYKILFNPDATAKAAIASDLWAEFENYNKLLSTQPLLMGEKLSLPDCVLWATVIRYDDMYARQFGIQGRSILTDYPHLAAFAKRMWNIPTKSDPSKTIGDEHVRSSKDVLAK